MPKQIVLENVTKTFSTKIRNPEYGSWKNFWRPDARLVHAVDHISLTVEHGERIAFIGPNGAGKSTTIKMMTGILRATSGKIRVAGLDPQGDRKALAYKIGTLFGQRSQLISNLPIADSFELFGVMYGIRPQTIRRRAKQLSSWFGLEEFSDRPVRKLSLGQRMRAEIAVSLLHKPEIIFLDEPTIGLDVVAKQALREVLNRLCEEEGVTLFLTSHDAGDIEALCERTIIVNHGRIIVDESTEALQQRYFTVKHVRVELADRVKGFSLLGAKNIRVTDRIVLFDIDTNISSVNTVIARLMQSHSVVDLDIANPSLEEVIGTVYAAQQ
ncbi:MAG: ATP-binding cassette domain-containing protein [Patescibacteria group bacterium]|jgi:ABC-2 type transport system ATP-binding protein